MDEAADEFHIGQAVTLRNGRPATIRPMRADGRQRLIDAFARLDRQSALTRFFSWRKELPKRPLPFVGHIDAVRPAAPVVSDGQGDQESVIASVTYAAYADSDGLCQALAGRLVAVRLLAERQPAARAAMACRHDVACLSVELPAANVPMRAVSRRSGRPLGRRHAGEVVKPRLDLGGPRG